MMIKKVNIIKYGKKIFKIVNNGNGELKIHEKIVSSDSDIPTDKIIKISSVTIVIMSLLEKIIKSLFVRNIKLNYKDVRIQ